MIRPVAASSSCETEYYGIVKCRPVDFGLRAVMKDFGMNAKVMLKSDTSAAVAVASRSGLGKVRHAELVSCACERKSEIDVSF